MTEIRQEWHGLEGFEDLLDGLSDPTLAQRVANAAAEAYTGDILDWIAEGRAFVSRHGAAGLEGAISWRPEGDGTAIVYANKDYAIWVEDGTLPHAIAPSPGRKALKIPTGGPGGYVLRRAVMHPGSLPFPFFFTDREKRDADMAFAARSVLLRAMGDG